MKFSKTSFWGKRNWNFRLNQTVARTGSDMRDTRTISNVASTSHNLSSLKGRITWFVQESSLLGTIPWTDSIKERRRLVDFLWRNICHTLLFSTVTPTYCVMAAPRKFAEKIARLKQQEEEGNRSYAEVMKQPLSGIVEVSEFLFNVKWWP